jgi:hypothetical protein
MKAPIMIVFLRPNLSIVNPPLAFVNICRELYARPFSYIIEPKKAPPEKVALMAPMTGDVFFVSKNARKFGD